MEVTDEGIKIVEELLRDWISQKSAQDGEDIIMDDDDDELSSDAQLEELKRSVEKFRPQIEGNPWLQSLLTSL